MAKPTPEQLQEFEEYLKTNQNKPVSEKALLGVIEDDIREAKEALEKREEWNRHYNSKEIPTSDKPKTAEAE